MSQQQPDAAQQLAALKAQMQQLQAAIGDAAPAPIGVQMPTMPRQPAAPLPTVTPAPDVQPLTPTQQMKVLMSQESWSVMQGLLRWAIMWEDVRKGDKLKYDDDTKLVMLAPWTFFGASPATLGNLFQYVTPAFMNALGQYEADEVFARANPMPWLMLQTVAPMLALIDKGRAAQTQSWAVIKQLRGADTIPLEIRAAA